MKIRAVEAFPLSGTLGVPLLDARSKITARTAVIVRVRADDGVEGWGEAASFGQVQHLVASTVEHLGISLIGDTLAPCTIAGQLMHKTAHYGQRGLVTSAIAGIEIALWDALGKFAGMSLCTMLGHTSRPIRTYATTAYYRAHDSAPTALERLTVDVKEAGQSGDFSGVKIKVGRFGVDDDIERVRAARAVLGPGPILIADANNAWTTRQALKVALAVESEDVLFLEEPIPFGSAEDSRWLRDRSPVAIAGYELENTLEAARQYIDARAVDVIQPDATWGGGIAAAIAVAECASRNGIRTVPHNFSTAIALAANAHVVCCSPQADLLEIDGTHGPISDVCKLDSWRWNGPLLEPSDASGLGVTVDTDRLEALRSTS